uniref:DUF6090 family protein n=2 Tax=Roseivirga sp. TaxID=1964215 RepID=UPI004047DC64
MIHFFRKIRQQQLLKSKFGKYVLYAIGEICLVVIGIMLAWSINNWSNYNTERKQELKLLEQIKADVQANQNEIQRLKKVVGSIQEASDNVIESLERKEKFPYFNISASVLHRKYYLKNSSSGYTMLNNGLITLIQNTDLRNDIIQLYESTYLDLITREQWMLDYLDQSLNPQSNRLFRIQENMEINIPDMDETSFDVFAPINFDLLSENIEYINTLKAMRKMNALRIIAIESAESKSTEVLKTLELNLQQLNKR